MLLIGNSKDTDSENKDAEAKKKNMCVYYLMKISSRVGRSIFFFYFFFYFLFNLK